MGTENTAACNDYVLGGGEPINWAYITSNGRSQAPANPLFTGTTTIRTSPRSTRTCPRIC